MVSCATQAQGAQSSRLAPSRLNVDGVLSRSCATEGFSIIRGYLGRRPLARWREQARCETNLVWAYPAYKENEMKRIDALRGMRGLMLLLVFLAGYTAAGTAQEVDDAVIEINPSEYVPLAVGNSWTYEHSYVNGSYTDEGPKYDIEARKPFEIPGYPHGEGNALPPRSLLFSNRILTIEITHTERIDGQEYFVFSDADYDWPPLREFFWAGKKVRWSDEGFLVFRWVGQEVPIFDFGGLINDSYSYSITLPWESAPPVDIRRRGRFYEAPQTSKLHYLVNFDWYRWEADRWWGLGGRVCDFLPGYGIGRFSEAFYGLHWPIFENILTGISANIDGEEIWYDQLDPEGQRPPPEPIAVGKLAQQNVFGLFPGLRILPTKIDTISDYQGFDFSAGSTGIYEYDGDFEGGKHDFGIYQLTANDGSPTTPGYFSNPPGVGIADLNVYPIDGIFTSPPTTGFPEIIEGHTYAVWPRDGGLALMYVFHVGLWQTSFPNAGGAVADVVIEWMYDPESTFESPTAIQSTSWGRLKSNILRGP